MEDEELLLSAGQVRLRCLEPEDLDLLYTIENDPHLWEISSSRRPYSRYALRQYIAQQPHDIYQEGAIRLVIEERASASGIGLIDLMNYSPIDRRAEIGIALLAKKRGQGYGAEALQALEQYSCRILHIRQLYALVLANFGNASQRLFEKAGFQIVARLPKWHLYHGEFEDALVYAKEIEKNMV